MPQRAVRPSQHDPAPYGLSTVSRGSGAQLHSQAVGCRESPHRSIHLGPRDETQHTVRPRPLTRPRASARPPRPPLSAALRRRARMQGVAAPTPEVRAAILERPVQPIPTAPPPPSAAVAPRAPPPASPATPTEPLQCSRCSKWLQPGAKYRNKRLKCAPHIDAYGSLTLCAQAVLFVLRQPPQPCQSGREEEV